MSIKDKIIERNKKGTYCLPTWEKMIKLRKEEQKEIDELIQGYMDKYEKNAIYNRMHDI